MAPAAPMVAAAALAGDVQALSAASMAGRLTGSAGSQRAQAFILDRFRASGLQAVNGAYQQAFAFTHHSIRGLLTPGRRYRTDYPGATNLAGALRGSSFPDSWLIVSAHYDHLGTRGGELFPGADDNASGVASLLAAASYFGAHPPQHSMLFVAFDGEEEGLQGSRYFVAHPLVDIGRIGLLVNLDMVSRSDAGVIIASGTSRDPALRDLVTRAAAGSRLIIEFGHDRPIYAAGRVEDWTHASDHGPFVDAGVRTLYFGVEDHADYHQPTDTADRIPLPFFAEAASLVIRTLAAADTGAPGLSR